MSAGRWIAVGASVVVLASVVAGIAVIGPPSEQRELRLDRRRVADLLQISGALDRYEERHRALPADLATLAGQPGLRLSTRDPQTGEPYGYQALEERRYRLCARFATDTAERITAADPWALGDWHHPAGRHCFEREVGKGE